MSAHVLAVRLDNDGDVLLAGPAIRAVAAGAARVTLLCGPRGRAAAELLPGVDEVVVHRAAWIDPEPEPVEPQALLALVQGLAARRIDEAFVFTSFHQSPLPTALLLRLAGVPVVAATSEDYPGSLLDVRHRIDDDVHEVERSLSLVATLGYRLPDEDARKLAVKVDSECDSPAGGEPYVVVHPGASVPARTWPADRHATLVDVLVEEGRRVVVTGTAAESELTALVAGSARPEVLNLGGRTSFAGLGQVLRGADAVVVGNTGPAHLAAAMGTPVVSLYAPTVPAVRWRPWRVPHVLLGDQDAACAGTRARVCSVPGHPCLGCVSVEEVLAGVETIAAPRARVGAAA
jgi:ADP-heptose:LPS heptosyltransferase